MEQYFDRRLDPAHFTTMNRAEQVQLEQEKREEAWAGAKYEKGLRETAAYPDTKRPPHDEWGNLLQPDAAAYAAIAARKQPP